MKKIFLVLVIISMIFAGCSQNGSDDEKNSGNNGNNGSNNDATLLIKNESSYEVSNVLWNNTSFASSQTSNSIKPGNSVTMNVTSGSGYIRFKPATNPNPINLRTTELVTIIKGEKKEFVILNSTHMVDESNTSNSGTLSSFSGVGQITVKQEDAIINQYGSYNFGTVKTGGIKDITFTIENSGGANLTIEAVNGNRVNLTDNASGFFTINRQPLASSINPGNTTTFIIRFNPTVVDVYAAAVNIKTDSYNFNEFVFEIEGICSNVPQIGDRGSGEGIIFFAESGHIKECSFDLGTHRIDSTAPTVAKNHRGGGFTDWYLPDQGELTLMYNNLYKKGLGGFSQNTYASSTHAYSTYGGGAYYYYLKLPDGTFGESNSSTVGVRAVRTFTYP